MTKQKAELATITPINPTAVMDMDRLPAELTNVLETKIPDWAKELATDGTAVQRWNLEYLILLEEILRKDHGFTEDDMTRLEKRLKELLPVAHTMKLEEPKQLRKKDFALAMAIVDENKRLYKIENKRLSTQSNQYLKEFKKQYRAALKESRKVSLPEGEKKTQ